MPQLGLYPFTENTCTPISGTRRMFSPCRRLCERGRHYLEKVQHQCQWLWFLKAHLEAVNMARSGDHHLALHQSIFVHMEYIFFISFKRFSCHVSGHISSLLLGKDNSETVAAQTCACGGWFPMKTHAMVAGRPVHVAEMRWLT